jgi:pilus assembly protein Flp/PilA
MLRNTRNETKGGRRGLVITGKPMKITLKTLWQEEQGQDLVEYALVGALIALASIAALNNVAGLLTNAFTNAAANMSSTTT